jgi:hypothetical protein
VIFETYLGPDRATHEIMDIARREGRTGPLVEFSAACRKDLSDGSALPADFDQAHPAAIQFHVPDGATSSKSKNRPFRDVRR